MRYVLHKFRPSETIDAVMRLKGRHSYTQAELVELRKVFNELNGKIVPRAGDVYKIPLEEITVNDFGDVVSTVAQEPAIPWVQEAPVKVPDPIAEPEVAPVLVTSSRRRR